MHDLPDGSLAYWSCRLTIFFCSDIFYENAKDLVRPFEKTAVLTRKHNLEQNMYAAVLWRLCNQAVHVHKHVYLSS